MIELENKQKYAVVILPQRFVSLRGERAPACARKQEIVIK